jgi:hypothetical protein
MPTIIEKKPISVTYDGDGNPTTFVEFEDTVTNRHVVPIIHGGTGADSAADARTNLGLGGLSTLSEITVNELANNIDATDIGFIAYKAAELETERYINGVAFDGSADIVLDTDDIGEGTTNLYFTNARFDTQFATKDTDDLTEGLTNLYYTDARVSSYLTTNSYATQTYVDTEIANLVDSAPATLDTLNELAAALGDDANFSTTITNSIATKLAISDFSTYFDTDFALKDTDDLSEGVTNLYYTSTRFDTDFSGKTTTDLTEGTNLYYTTARFDTAFSGKDTDDLTEGLTNLYYTDARVGSYLTTNNYATQTYVDNAVATENEISEMNDVTLTSLATGEFLQYNGAVWVNVVPDTDDITEGTNLFYTQARFDTAFTAKDTDDLSEGVTNLYYTDARVSSYLTTNSYATQSYVDSAVAAENELSEMNDVSITTLTTSQFLQYNGANWVNITIDTDDVAEGTNLYYTSTRFDTDFSGKTTTDLTEGTNLYYTTARFDTAFSGKSTTDLTEGTNLYYTDARVGSYLTTNSYATQSYVDTEIASLVDSAPATLDTLNELAAALGDDANFSTTITNSIATKLAIADFSTYFNTDFALKDTDDLTEGATNLYFTTGRIDTHLSGGNGITYTTGAISVDATVITGQTAETTIDETNDLVLIYDNSASGLKKMTVANLLAGAGAGSMSSFTISDGSNTSTIIDSDTLTFSGTTNEVEVLVSGDSLTIGLPDTIVADVTGDIDGAIIITGKNESGSTIGAGLPVYISGQASSGTEFTVEIADADGSGTMPAIGVTTASASNNASVSILTFGKFVGLNTSSFSVGDELYVSTSGTLTNTAPTGETASIQKIAKVTRSHATDGAIFVQGAGRTNAVPNLDNGDIFIGNASNQSVTASFNTTFDTQLATKDTDDVTEGVTNLYYTDARADARIALASIDDLSDVDTTTSAPSTGQILKWDGSNFVPSNESGGTVTETFKTISVSGQSDVVADGATDTLTFSAGTGMTITTDAGTDTITFESSGGAGGGGSLPVILSGATSDPITLSNISVAGAIPFTAYDGTTDNIDLGATQTSVTVFSDNDADTKIELEQTTDDDTIRFTAGGTNVLNATSAGVTVATQTANDNSTKVATTAYVDTALSGISSNSVSDADADTLIQVEESADEDIIRVDTAGQERLTIDNNVSMSARGGFFTHNLTMDSNETFTIASTEGTVAAGPLDIQGTVDVQGSLVVL